MNGNGGIKEALIAQSVAGATKSAELHQEEQNRKEDRNLIEKYNYLKALDGVSGLSDKDKSEFDYIESILIQRNLI